MRAFFDPLIPVANDLIIVSLVFVEFIKDVLWYAVILVGFNAAFYKQDMNLLLIKMFE